MSALLTFTDQLRSISLVLMLLVLARFVREAVESRPRWVRVLVTGVLYGTIGLVAMRNPFVAMAGGVKSDPRVALVCLAGMLGGPVPALIAAAMCGALRIAIGGAGMHGGLASLAVGALLGMRLRGPFGADPEAWGTLRFGVLGLALGAVCLFNSVFLPAEEVWTTVVHYAPLTLFVHGLTTMLGGHLEQVATVRRRSVQRLREHARLLELSQAAGQIGTWAKDLESGVLELSAELQRLTGAPAAGPLPAGIDLAPGATFEFRLGDRSLWGRTVVVAEPGKPRRLVGVVQDVTDRRTAEARLLQTAKLTCLGELAAGVVHEINNPLLVARLHLSILDGILKKAGALPPRAAASVTQIAAATDRISRISSGLRRFIRNEPAREEVFAADVVVRRSVDFMQVVTGTGGRAVCVATRAPLANVAGDPDKLEQVLVNLLANALHATEGLADGRISVETATLDGCVRIAVGDNGTGIPPERLARVFEPFYTTKESGKGTGLGLSISRSLVEAMGGELAVASTVGLGTTFTLTLPATDSAFRQTDSSTQGDGR